MPPKRYDIENLVEGMLQEMRANSIALASFAADVKTMANNLGELMDVVLRGTDGHSLVTRVALIEKQLEESAESQEMRESDGKEDHRTRLLVWAAIIPAVLGLGVSLFQLLS